MPRPFAPAAAGRGQEASPSAAKPPRRGAFSQQLLASRLVESKELPAATEERPAVARASLPAEATAAPNNNNCNNCNDNNNSNNNNNKAVKAVKAVKAASRCIAQPAASAATTAVGERSKTAATRATETEIATASRSNEDNSTKTTATTAPRPQHQDNSTKITATTSIKRGFLLTGAPDRQGPSNSKVVHISDTLDIASPEILREPFFSTLWLDPTYIQDDIQDLASRTLGRQLGLRGAGRDSPYGSCSLVGTMNGTSSRLNMAWDGLSYRCCVQLGISDRGPVRFQVQHGLDLDRLIYPSVDGATMETAHQICGPDNLSSSCWAIIDRGPRPISYEVAMACPRGCPTSLGWARLPVVRQKNAKGYAVASPGEEESDGSEEDETQELPSRLGQWHLRGFLGQGHQGAVVYLGSWRRKTAAAGAEAGGPGLAAVKYPVELEELRTYARIQDLSGVPTLLDFGACRRGQIFMVMPVVSPSVDEILRGRCDHDGLGGRIAWPAAAGLGARLLLVLQRIHEKGVVHCDLKPGNLLVPNGEPWVQLIDFGRSGMDGSAVFEPGHGGMRDYMSIKAGLTGGLRTPADDLESLGWLLLRCVLGGFPWSAKAKPREDESWEEGSQRVARAKLRFLDPAVGPQSFGSAKGYCPPELMEYFRAVELLGECGWQDIDYDALARPLRAAAFAPTGLTCAWERLVRCCFQEVLNPLRLLPTKRSNAFQGAEGTWDWPALASTLSNCVYWRPLSQASCEDAEPRCHSVQRGQLLRLSGRFVEEEDGRFWVEVDCVWSPGVPDFLLKGSWLLAFGRPRESSSERTGASAGWWLELVEHGRAAS
ncbi:unnamed protein product [Polarella glacialis]|uniref:Casein kinase I n=1 Tax=Polarella glacialis TaxID=89957 RepID=A0A813L5X4_POLGL|nr:unnamed protein product [Polarella glacialis]